MRMRRSGSVLLVRTEAFLFLGMLVSKRKTTFLANQAIWLISLNSLDRSPINILDSPPATHQLIYYNQFSKSKNLLETMALGSNSL